MTTSSRRDSSRFPIQFRHGIPPQLFPLRKLTTHFWVDRFAPDPAHAASPARPRIISDSTAPAHVEWFLPNQHHRSEARSPIHLRIRLSNRHRLVGRSLGKTPPSLFPLSASQDHPRRPHPPSPAGSRHSAMKYFVALRSGKK